MRKAGLILCLLVLPWVLGGCWDRTEIEDTGFVSTIGVDVLNGDYRWTFRMVQSEQLPIGMMSSIPPSGNRFPAGHVSVRAKTLNQALQLVQASAYRVISLDQLRYIIFGEETARRGLEPLVSQLLRHNQVRRSVGVVVTRGSAVESMLSFRPSFDVNPVKAEEGILLVEKRSHLSPPVRLQQFVNRMLVPGMDPILPMRATNPQAKESPDSPIPEPPERSLDAGEFPRHGGSPVELAGTAIFRGDRMVGSLNVDETWVLMALRGEMGKVFETVPDPAEPDQPITLRLFQENKPKLQAAFVGGRPTVNIKLQLEAEVVSAPGRTDYPAQVNRRRLEDWVEKHLSETLYAPTIQKIYRDWEADPIGVGNLFRTRFATFDDWLAYRWADHVHELRANVEIVVLIRRFGVILENPSIESKAGRR